MKFLKFSTATATVLCALTTSFAEDQKSQDVEAPPVTFNNSNLKSGEVYVYEQKSVAGRPVLIAPETATALIGRFKTNYTKLGSPRMVIYVNRDLIDDAGLKLAERKERVQINTTEVQSDPKADRNTTTNVNTKTQRSTQENTYRQGDKTAATLADRQTIRDVERLFGRPLRMAGVTIADQRIASQLIGAANPDHLQTDQSRKDREALSKIADVAIEILISSRNTTVAELSGDRTYAVPDIQATATRLSDARVIGQATAADIIGKDTQAIRNFDVREIAEATALSLMEDILQNAE
ncbi:MAG TPA: hypothetical protein VF773_18190 [Verrucomicrobiae bacterium]